MHGLLFIVSSVIVVVHGQSLPLELCYQGDPDFNECFANLLNVIKPFIQNGLSVIGLPPLEPFVVPSLNISHKSANNNFNSVFKPFVFHNLLSYHVNQFEWNENTMRTQLSVGKVVVTTFYKIIGTLLDVPVDGSGRLEGQVDGANANIKIVKDFVKRNGVNYCKVLQVKIKLRVTNPYLHVTSVRKNLIGMTNEILNSRPKELEEMVSNVLARIFEVLFKKYLGVLCDAIPFDVLIPVHLNKNLKKVN